jgi:hypothetical protein
MKNQAQHAIAQGYALLTPELIMRARAKPCASQRHAEPTVDEKSFEKMLNRFRPHYGQEDYTKTKQ